MQLKNTLLDGYKKQCWLEFRLHNNLLVAYTIKKPFEEEMDETLELLAYENNCDKQDIKIKRIYK